jgi:hypothetical protein
MLQNSDMAWLTPGQAGRSMLRPYKGRTEQRKKTTQLRAPRLGAEKAAKLRSSRSALQVAGLNGRGGFCWVFLETHYYAEDEDYARCEYEQSENRQGVRSADAFGDAAG